MFMIIRPAKVNDVEAINAIICDNAEQDRMLFRSLADIYENLQTFLVAQSDTCIAGCCALEVVWSDLAEIKSLAVDDDVRGQGVGRALVERAVDQGRGLAVPRIFALTLEPGFFEKLGFAVVAKEALPMKVWRDCARCPKQQECDEIAVIRPTL
jgi:amino-acid N-acetyltransferase